MFYPKPLQHFPLALFARFYRVTDEALIAETAVWPIFFLSYECFLLKDLNFLFLFVIVAAGVVPCGGRKKSQIIKRLD